MNERKPYTIVLRLAIDPTNLVEATQERVFGEEGRAVERVYFQGAVVVL